jgi:hypothetical protein
MAGYGTKYKLGPLSAICNLQFVTFIMHACIVYAYFSSQLALLLQPNQFLNHYFMVWYCIQLSVNLQTSNKDESILSFKRSLPSFVCHLDI